MRPLVEALCSDLCAGRKTGTPGGVTARGLVVDALREAGLDPQVQDVPACGGANVLATVPGEIDRWVLVAAHYDHLGATGSSVFRGADDNAASVAMLVELARALGREKIRGRGVILAAFDAEEPPHFMTGAMGSEHFARQPTVPLASIDLMVCLELVGHALGAEGLPSDVRDTTFLLGAERSEGTRDVVAGLARSEPGVVVRAADAEVIPPLSDYVGFWERQRPFVLLTSGRSRVYHTPDDTPARLAWPKIEAAARWLERFVRASCARDERPFAFRNVRDDVSTLDSLVALLDVLAPTSEAAAMGAGMARQLRGACRADGTVPEAMQGQLAMLVEGIESGLA